jgi:hypothetical protein
MKVLVEIDDKQIVAALRQSVETCLSVCLPRSVPLRESAKVDLFTAIEFCLAANKVIKHFGGDPVQLDAINPYPPQTE